MPNEICLYPNSAATSDTIRWPNFVAVGDLGNEGGGLGHGME